MTTFPLVLNIPYGGTISGLTIQCESGNGVGTITIDGVPVTGLTNIAISTTEVSYFATGANTFVPLQDIKIEFSVDNSLFNVSPNLAIVRVAPPATTSTISTTSTGSTIDGSKEENIIYPLSSGVIAYTIPFAYIKTDYVGNPTTSYNIFQENPCENLDDNPQLIIFGSVVGRTATGINVQLSATPDSNNYVYRANVKVL